MNNKKREIIVLLLTALFMMIGIAVVWSKATIEKNEYYDVQVKAAEQMQSCMKAILDYKGERNILLSDEDKLLNGMLGESYNEMTTTRGDAAAKRTTANPDMAAMMVKEFYSIGLKPDDKIGIGCSGSFPAMNIAAICAAESMELQVVVISSIGASTYGANNIGFSFPEMLHTLKEDGYVKADSEYVTAGGDGDIGTNMGGEELRETQKRIEDMGLEFYNNPDLGKNVQRRIKTYGEIDAYVAIGGNITNFGAGEEPPTHKKGIWLQNKKYSYKDEVTGVVQYYATNAIPTANIQDIKGLVAEHGIIFDPDKVTEVGNSPIYYYVAYNKVLTAFFLITGLIVLFLVYYRKKQEYEND